MDTFTLEICLGNEAMQHPADVADALRRTADRFDSEEDWLPNADAGAIRDLNGNTTGHWTVA